MNHVIWNELGLLHFNAGAYAQAINAYQHAVQNDTHFLPARLNLARAYFRNGNLLQAEETYKNCFDLGIQDAEQADIWMQLGQFYAQTGRHDESQTAFDLAESLRMPVLAEIENDIQDEENGTPPKIEMDTASSASAASGHLPFAEVKLESIYINPRQPRMRIDVDDLVESIREHGVLQPILVSPNGDENHYILVSGHRRLEAARQVGLDTIPAVIRKVDERERLELALTENLQRLNLSSFEQADAYAQLRNEFELSPEEIARRMGKSSIAIDNLLRQLTLPERIKRALDFERIQPGHARALLKLDDPAKQLNAFEQVLQHDLSVRKTEALVRLLKLELEQEPDKVDAPEKHQPAEASLQEDAAASEINDEKPEPPSTEEGHPEPAQVEEEDTAEAGQETALSEPSEKESDAPSDAWAEIDTSHPEEPPAMDTSTSTETQTEEDSEDHPQETGRLQEIDTQDPKESLVNEDAHLRVEAGENVVMQNPANEEAWRQLAENYSFLGENEKAVQAYQKALSLNPQNGIYYEKLGQLYIEVGQYAEAADLFEQALVFDEGNIYLHCALASSYKRQGLEDEARSHIEFVAPKMADEKSYNRACFESICGNPDTALELLETAMEEDSAVTVQKINDDHDFDFIRDDKRFSEFLNRKTPLLID